MDEETSDYELVDYNCYEVDHDLEAPIVKTIDFNEGIAKEYLSAVILGVFDKKKNRIYEFRSPTSEVCRLVCNDRVSDFEGASLAISERLHRSQRKRQDELRLDKKLTVGTLFVIHFTQNDREYILLSKHDPEGVLDLEKLQIVNGLPDKKKSYKGCLITINGTTVDQVLVRDTSQSVADYWFNLFLELDPVRLDVDNIATCFSQVDNVLQKYRSKYPVDIIHIRNHLISQLKRDNTVFDYQTDFIDYIERLDAQHPKFPKSKLTATLNELPNHDKRGFDLNFKCIPAAVNARKVGEYVPLNDFLDLHIRDAPTNDGSAVIDHDELANVVTAFKDAGIKYVKIKGDRGYEAFRRK